MGQKLGFLLTNPPNTESMLLDAGTHLYRVDPAQEFRELSQLEI